MGASVGMDTVASPRYLIVGAGPTGLGAAYRLLERGEKDFLVLERNGFAGGLASSFQDENGFTWDVGGHVIFSHYEYFDRLLDVLLGDESLLHERKAYIHIDRRWVPYPFQNNIRHLSPEAQWECIQGLMETELSDTAPDHFGEWILRTFGAGIARLFMFPYNFKVWAFPPEQMDWRWIGERVSVVDVKRVLRNIVFARDDVSWGPNQTFRFPLKGGTGELFRRLANRVKGHIVYDAEVGRWAPREKWVETRDGRRFAFDRLLNTSPLDRWISEAATAAPVMVREAATQLEHNGVHIVGVGVDGAGANGACWMYFPEEHIPFYRLTHFHHYSPYNTAVPGRQRAYMAEVSFSGSKQENLSLLMDHSIEGLQAAGLMSVEELPSIVSRWEMTADYGYPVPTRHRDASLEVVQPWLEEQGVFSRGRFGGWKYEVSNMDHSVMQGVEWADRMLSGARETTYARG